jgi:hypothetical protein
MRPTLLAFALTLLHFSAAASEPDRSGPPLAQTALSPLPLGRIRPHGWLARELRHQADGLTGHLDEVWPDVGLTSGWLGGAGESGERGPYFLDGLVPLAFLLGDAKLIAKARRFVDWALKHQTPEGLLGPPRDEDWWPRFVLLKALLQWQEATDDPRVIPAMRRYFAYQAARLDAHPLAEWARYRWADELVSIFWAYRRTHDPELLALAQKLHNQGADWRRHFDHFEFRDKTTSELMRSGDRAMRTHGVNNAMALKAAPLWSLLSG